MSNARRVVATVCIALLVVTTLVPVVAQSAPGTYPSSWSVAPSFVPSTSDSAHADLIADVVLPLGPLFGAIVSVPLPPAILIELRPAPFLSLLRPRAPPVL